MSMRLSTRLSCYFLTAMATVLVGFSAALHLIASKHLHRQADERLDSALNMLAAAAEIGPDGVEWEPEERSLSFGRRTLEGQFFWRVGDDRGMRIDGSATGEIDRFLARQGEGIGPSRRLASVAGESGSAWRAMTLRLVRPSPDGENPMLGTPAPGRHSALVLGAAASLESVQVSLRNLGLTLGCLSLAIWTLALVTGRKLCQMTLRPLTEMAESAQEIGGEEPGSRLPTRATDDELGELSRSFNALLDRLGESLERQKRFAGDASHQLRTPLTALQGQVEVALRHDRSAEEYRRVLGLVRSKTRHLCQIVDGLMFLSRADAEARRLELERITLDTWLRQYLDTWHNPRQSDVIFESHEAEGSQACVHPPLFGELLNNLLDNAAKYSPPGTPIRGRLCQEDHGVSFSISNEGPGIDRADLPNIFDPFFRAEAARSRGSVGVGLGLSVAARIAAVFGGRIIADSEPGLGATFTLTLPTSEA